MAVNYTPDYESINGNMKTLKPFRFWCQKVLPLVYDDSLSYYELLNKVVQYLNDTMENVDGLNDNVNTLDENVRAIYQAYNQLQDYVNNYFDNLNVQEEINNKLDTMATDGSLSAIVEPILPDIVSDWLDENVEPTTPIVDNSLTISGAAADAKTTGDNIAEIKNALNNTSAWWAPDDTVFNSRSARKQNALKHIRDIQIITENASDTFTLNGTFLNDSGNYVIHVVANGVDAYAFNVAGSSTPVWAERADSTRKISILCDTNGLTYPDSYVSYNEDVEINKKCVTVLDTTLTSETLPAQGKAVGDAIEAVIESVDNTLSIYGKPADSGCVGVVENGYFVFPYTKVENSYPDNNGDFQEYSGWDRTGYIPITQKILYFANLTRTSSDNAMYDTNHTFLGRFTVGIGEHVAVTMLPGTKYVVVSNKREDFYKCIYEQSPILSGLNDSITELETNKIDVNKLNCDFFDWTLFASDEYPLGWRNGRYNIETGEGDESGYYLRTLRTASIIKMVNGAKYFTISVPDGYAVSVCAYNENTDAFIQSWGNPDSRSVNATNELTIEVVHGYNYKFTVGRFANNDSGSHINDSTLINSFVLKIYWDIEDDVYQYYFPYIQNRVNRINEIRRTSNVKSFSFIFITDYHLIRNAQQSPKLIKYICKNTGVSDVIFGGDAFQNWRDLSQSMSEISKVYNVLRDSTIERFLCVYGNHEWNDITGQENTLAGVTQMTVRSLPNLSVLDEYGDYYIDNELCKTRIYFLNCDVGASIPWNSILWLGNQLNNIPAGYFAMVICHCGLLNGPQGIYQKNTYENVNKLLGAYDSHTSVTLIDSSENVRGTFDYSGSTGSTICYLSGHTHEDLLVTKSDDPNGVLTFTTTGDLYKNASGTHYSFVNENDDTIIRNVGTIYENAFDVIHVDTVARKIHCVRIGAGLDRELDF